MAAVDILAEATNIRVKVAVVVPVADSTLHLVVTMVEVEAITPTQQGDHIVGADSGLL